MRWCLFMRWAAGFVRLVGACICSEPVPFMRIVQTVFGVFHHFNLARELERRGHLERVYSTWPWRRLRREGLERGLVETYPWLHMAEYAAGRSPVDLRWLSDHLGYANALAFDRWTEKRLKSLKDKPDALIGISGSSLAAGAWLQREGGVFICDRGTRSGRRLSISKQMPLRSRRALCCDPLWRWGCLWKSCTGFRTGCDWRTFDR